MAMLPPLPGGDWRGEECAHIDRLRTACKNTEHWELESSRTDAGDPWCLIYDRHQHRIVLHFARIDRRYVIVWPQLKRSASGATIAAGMRVHRIAREMMTDLGASSKLNAEWEFFSLLHAEGRRSAQMFLDTHAFDLGRLSTLDLDFFLQQV